MNWLLLGALIWCVLTLAVLMFMAWSRRRGDEWDRLARKYEWHQRPYDQDDDL